MKGYDSYKTINIDWLDKLPSHWKTIQIKQLNDGEDTLFIDGDWIESTVITDYGIRYLTTGNIGSGFYKEQGSGFINEETFENLNCTEVFPGDLLISRLNEPIGRACIIPDLGYRIITAVDNVILRPKKPFDIRFLMHLMNSPEYSAYTSLISRGATMKRISRGLLGGIKIPFPSGEEQTAIASFLDYKTNLIDATIEKKKRLIELLKEKRQAVINEAVTKGLNPNARMKNSGVEWLGEIPEHWKVVYLKHIGEAITGITYSPDDVMDEGTLVLRSSNIQNGKLSLNDCVFVNKNISEKYITRKNDLLICSRNGSRNLIGKNILIDDEIENQSWGAFMTVYRSCYNDFIYYFFNSDIFTALSSLFLSSTINQLTIGTINNFQIAFPNDDDERNEIIKFLSSSNLKINKTIKKLEIQIEKLQAYRQSLISEAVTGKIDVRDWEIKNN